LDTSTNLSLSQKELVDLVWIRTISLIFKELSEHFVEVGFSRSRCHRDLHTNLLLFIVPELNDHFLATLHSSCRVGILSTIFLSFPFLFNVDVCKGSLGVDHRVNVLSLFTLVVRAIS